MSSFPSYMNKEIPEWNSSDLSNWLLDNKFKKISEICKKYGINGYDLFFLNEEILKTEFGISSFHERISILKTLKKLIYAHLKLNIINSQNGDQTTLLLDNNLTISLEDITKSVGNIFNINPDDIIYKDYSQHQIISPTIKIVELMILFPKIYKSLNISNFKNEENENKNIVHTAKKVNNKNYNMNNPRIKSNKSIPCNNNYINKEFEFKENYNKVKNDYKIINNNDNEEINNNLNNNKNINSENNNVNSGNNSSSYKPSIELYMNDNENSNDINNEMENEKFVNEKKKSIFKSIYQNIDDNQRNNIKVNRNYTSNRSPSHFINFNRPNSFKEKNKNKSLGKNRDIENNLYNNELLYNKKRYLNIHDGLSIENSDYLDKNASSNEGENKSKIYINNIIKNSGGESECSVKNNSFPSMSYSDKINNNPENNDKMDLRHLNNEIPNDNDTRPLNMKQSYKGPQKNRVFNEDIIGGNL